MVGEGEWNSVGFFVLWCLWCRFLIDFLGMMSACGNSGVRVAMVFETRMQQVDTGMCWLVMYACR